MLALCGKNIQILYIRNKKDTWQNVLRDLNKAETIKKIKLSIDAKNVEIISIWDEETAYLKNNELNDLKYGAFVKGNI